MSFTTTFGLVRHGVTDWNKDKRVQGMTDIPLNEEGVRQAELLAERLGQERWDVIYSSDLSRASHTARIIAQASNQIVEGTDERLRERGFGEAEGTTEEERLRRWGPQWRNVIRGVEADEAVFERGMSILHSLLQFHSGRRIIIVSHGAWIVRILHGLFPGLEFPYIGNTSLSAITHEAGLWTPELIGCELHLGEADHTAWS